MKFNVSSTTLCNRLQTLSRVQSSKSSLPILDCILFELEGGILRMTASDSETTVVSTLEVTDVDGFGKFAVGSKQLINSIKEISEQPITFNINLDSYQIEVYYQNGHYSLIGQNADEYPVPASNQDDRSTLVIPAAKLLNGISCSLFAAADDEIRPQMNGIFFDITPDYTTMVASDGHKLVRDRLLEVKGDSTCSFIMPKKPAVMLKTILPKETNDVRINFNDRNADVELENYKISCRLIEGRFPNYNSVIPQDNPFRVRVDRPSFISALRRVSVFASESSSLIKLHIDNNNLQVSAQDIDFSTSAEENILCEYDGNTMSIGFNGPFLLEVLNSISSQDIILELADPSRAGVVVPADQDESEDLIMLLMPMMLQD